MKLSTSALAILASITAASALAAEKPVFTDRVFGSVFYEYYMPDKGKKSESPNWSYLDNGDGYGLELGYYFNEQWALRLDYGRLDLENGLTGSEIKSDRWGLNLLYTIPTTGVYIAGGLTHLNPDNLKNTNAINLGVGYKHFFNDNFALFAEMNRIQGVDKSFGDANAKAGFTVLFGSSPVVAAPTPAPVVAPVVVVADSDKDGVPDDRDLCPNTPITDKVDENGCSIFTEKEVNFSLKAQFAHDSDVVRPEYDAEIADLAAFLKRFPGTDVEISGHASNVGAPAYNMKLSQRRADAIAKILVNKHGIDASRVSAKGYGITRPKVEGNTKEAHAANRRIEAKVTATVKKAVQRQ